MNIDRKNTDKISHAYNGEFGVLSKQKSKTRIDWICKKVKGKNILDVGCSQGITSILLGKESKNVIGIDLSIESIEYAEKLKYKENDEIADNINFIQGDFLQYKFNKKFDTIIMGGILEHVFKPEAFIVKVFSLLNENGRIIITVPFGINSFPEHKRTYYFLELFLQIGKRIAVSDVNFFGGWIGFVADRNSENNVILNEQLMSALENSFFEVDMIKQKQIDRYKEEIESMKKKSMEMAEKMEKDDIKLDKLNFWIEKMEERLKKIEFRVKKISGKSDVKSKNFISLIDKLYQVNIDIAELRAEKLIREKEITKFKDSDNNKQIIINEYEDKNEKLLQDIDEAILKNKKTEQELREKEDKIFALQNLLNEAEIEKKEKERILDSLEEKLKEIERHNEKLLNERTSNILEIQSLNEEVEYSYDKALKIEKENVEKDKEITALKDRVYEQEANIKEIIGQLESHKSKIEKLNRVRKRLEKEKEYYNTLLYKTKRINNAYEKLSEVKLYNFARRLKHKNTEDDSTELVENLNLLNRERVREKEEYRDKLIKLAEMIPDSNGSKYFQQSNLRMGIIADEFQLETYGDVAEVIYLSPKNYRADIDILFVVSTWHGLNDDWTGLGRVKESGGVKDALFNIINYHRRKGVKIVFYSKEDPGNYNVFLYIAKECDFIFTSDIDCVPKYIEDTGNPNVFVLPFAINPMIHNPIGFEEYMRDEVIFAGTWGYANKYPERNLDMSILFDGVIASDKNLRIFDRNFYLGNDAYKYPLRYDEYVYPPIAHATLMKVHKLFKWAININSSKYSESMFASRVYELQACGSLIISNFNIGIKEMFPNVFIEFFPHLIKETFERLNPIKEYELQLEGIRKMYGTATIYHRFNYILEKIGFEKYKQNLEKKILVIVTDSSNKNNLENFNRQSYKNKIITGIKDITEDLLDSVEMVTYFDEKSYYGKYYLEDMLNCFKYTNSDFVTKDSYYNGRTLREGTKNGYCEDFSDVHRTVFWRESYVSESIKNGDPECEGIAKGYAADMLNYNSNIER